MVELDVTRGIFRSGEIRRGIPGYVYDSVDMQRESRQIKQLREEMLKLGDEIKTLWTDKPIGLNTPAPKGKRTPQPDVTVTEAAE